MSSDAMRAKAAALFGKGFMDAAKPQPPAKNAAVASQKVANSRPIPTYKVGGVVSNKAVDDARVATRAKAAGLKKGGVPKKADGGSVDRDKSRLDRKIADIEKDFRKAIAGGKDKDVAEAKKAQRMADARDDYAKWTGADRTATRAAERSAERELTMTRRYGAKKPAIEMKDEPSVSVSRAEVMESRPTPKASEPSAPARAAAPKPKAAPAPRAAAPASRAPAPAPRAAPTPRAASASRAAAKPQPARRASTATADRAASAERGAAAQRRAMAQNPDSAASRRGRLAEMLGLPGSPGYAERNAAGMRARAMREAEAQAEKDAFAYRRNQELARLKAKAEAPGASTLDKSRYFYAKDTGMVNTRMAVGGAAKVRKGQAPAKKGQ